MLLKLQFLSLLVTALKSLLLKGNAKTKLDGDYSSFNKGHLKEHIDNNLKNNCITEFFWYSSIKMHLSKKRY